MKRVALRGLAARPVRTILTTLAIVLGVAMVSGAFTLTDTMRGGADGQIVNDLASPDEEQILAAMKEATQR